MKEEKCCVNCKHCVRRYYGETEKFYCALNSRTDRVSGVVTYNSCYAVADTDKCKFEKSHWKLIETVLLSICAVCTCILFWRFIYG